MGFSDKFYSGLTVLGYGIVLAAVVYSGHSVRGYFRDQEKRRTALEQRLARAEADGELVRQEYLDRQKTENSRQRTEQAERGKLEAEVERLKEETERKEAAREKELNTLRKAVETARKEAAAGRREIGTMKWPSPGKVKTEERSKYTGQRIDLIEPDGWAPIRWQSRLMLNNEKYRTGRRGTEADGIEDMRRLALEEEEEEAWIYLPQAEVWIEVGVHLSLEEAKKNEKIRGGNPEELLAAITADEIYINRLLEANPGVTKYSYWHTHPAKANQRFVELSIKKLPEITKDAVASLEFEASVVCSLPSKLDLRDMTSNSQWLREIFANRRIFPTGRIIEYSIGIRSPYGACIVRPTEAGMERFRKQDASQDKAYFSNLFNSARIETRLPPELAKEGRDSRRVKEHRQRVLETACITLSNDDVTFGFEVDE